MTTANLIRVAIIGCGKIGTEWDRANPTNVLALTHARGFSEHPLVQLVAVCDTDGKRAHSAAQHWQVPNVYVDPQQLFAKEKIDLAVIAASSSERGSIVKPALASGVKVLLIEKPLATTLEESYDLVAAIDAAGARSIVNYSRNWDPSMRDIRDRIAAGALGKVQRVVATYGKGIGNNGSHLIDLTGFLCGAFPLRARALGSLIDPVEVDWSTTCDRTWDAQVELIDAEGASINLTLLGTDHNAFTCFELRVIGRKAMFDLSMGGRRLHWTELQKDPNFSGYVVPSLAQALPSRYAEAMQEMVNETVQLVMGKISKVSCDAHSALRTALAVEAIQRSAKSHGKWVVLDNLNNESREGS